MKAIPISALAINTYYDRPVYLDEGYILLSPDSPVNEDLLQRLRKWKFTEVFTDGSPRQVPGYLEGMQDAALAPQTIDEDIKEDEQREAARAFCAETSAFVAAIFEQVAADGTVDLAKVTEWTKQAIQATRDWRDWMMRFAWAEGDPNAWLIHHAMRTALLSLLIGDYLKAPPHRLIELGNAALLHDIGMLRMPEAVQRGKGSLSPEERRALMAHTVLGYRVLKAVSAPENVALAALEHHERADGSGYPRSLPGARITEYARIIAVGCSYEAMISTRPFRPATFAGHEAIRELLQKSRARYDERVLKALVYILSVYPIGTYVLLSNGSRGQVVRTDLSKPRCPVVRVLADAEGKRPPRALLVQTTEGGGVSVTRALSAAEAREVARS